MNSDLDDSSRRELEIKLSELDRATQHFAEYVVKGYPVLYDRELPIRGIVWKDAAFEKRIELVPLEGKADAFRKCLYAYSITDEGKDLVLQPEVLDALPSTFREQMNFYSEAREKLDSLTAS